MALDPIKAKGIAAAIILACWLIIMALITGGCSTTKVNRGGDVPLDVSHTTFLIKTEAPSLEAERVNEDQYRASFNADGRGSDMEAFGEFMNQMMRFFRGMAPPQPAADDDG